MEGLEKFRRLTQESTETELNLDFNPCDLTSGDLCGVVLTFFYKLGLIQLLGLEPEGFLDFVLAVEAGELASEPLRRKLCRLLLHAADISNAVRPWTLCKTWSDLAVSEFFHQGDLEKRNNLPISPNMDRSHADQPQIALDFEELIVKPYFDMLAEFIPSCCIFLKTLDDNRKKWIELKRFFPEASCELTDNLSKEKRMSFASGTVLIPTQFQTELNILSSDLTKTTDGRRLFREQLVRFNVVVDRKDSF
ncbi:hypothetical protein L0F63_002366 [Massospora cicadina]|nr:hypothetical protein L0F63_002366 [Massospora cicadina]